MRRRPPELPQDYDGARILWLTRGLVTFVDAEDFDWLSQYAWHAHSTGKKMYAARNRHEADGPGPCIIYMHRVISESLNGMVTDHANGFTLDNRRSNLRPATYIQNSANCNAVLGAVPYRGVYFDKRKGRYLARIRADGRTKQLGSFDCPIAAAHAYDAGAIRHHGAFANVNFPEVA